MDELRKTLPDSPPSELLTRLVNSFHPVSDKWTDHGYQELYASSLLPLVDLFHRRKQRVKLLEIGLGCDQKYGVGASYAVWDALLDVAQKDEIWGADNNATCATSVKDLPGIGLHLLVGDQSNLTTLDSWINASDARASPFSVVIDDGGHCNHEIYNSLTKFFPLLEPGGVYILEDLWVGRERDWADPSGDIIMIDVIKDWVEQLTMHKVTKLAHYHHPLPEWGIKSIACMHHACVITKCGPKQSFCPKMHRKQGHLRSSRLSSPPAR